MCILCMLCVFNVIMNGMDNAIRVDCFGVKLQCREDALAYNHEHTHTRLHQMHKYPTMRGKKWQINLYISEESTTKSVPDFAWIGCSFVLHGMFHVMLK